MSPAEIVFGHPLRHAFSFVNCLLMFTNRSIRRTWREVWRAKEDTLRLRAGRNNAALRTIAPYVPCIVVTACSSKIKLATTLVNVLKLAQSLRSWDSINMLSNWVDRDASFNVSHHSIDGSSVSSHKWYTTPYSCLVQSYLVLPIAHSFRHFDTYSSCPQKFTIPPRSLNNPLLKASC